MSRRAAEKAIEAGRVVVNGERANLGDKADIDTDVILIDGKPIKGNSRFVYVMLNKPKGYVTTLSDDKNRPIVTDLLKEVPVRVFPVGRLDMNSEGLLLFTNDGDFANRMMHPSHEITKTYKVYVGGEDIAKKVRELEKPITINGRLTQPAKAELIDDNGSNATVRVVIKEGRNRQVRRLCENAGLKVKALTRIAEGPLSLGNLKLGAWRYLTQEEVSKLI